MKTVNILLASKKGGVQKGHITRDAYLWPGATQNVNAWVLKSISKNQSTESIERRTFSYPVKVGHDDLFL